ncbi:glycosyltransferase [Tenacibaculum aquimarinum]|uniref:glycosyltransferase n=1 Tax=Tenacibaculum aquimarinum TaxID=2910675 RepID=UPI002160EAFD|nr:glycosyltransferase [Tenacibaculum aquimarinum]
MYKNDEKTLQHTVDCFLKTPVTKKLFLVDNSPTDILKELSNHKDIIYIFNGKNLGFGSGHNTIINQLENLSNYHLILNPDVSFSETVIPNLCTKLAVESNVSMIAPKVVFPDGKHQFSSRKYPKPIDLISRRLGLFKSRVRNQQYQKIDLSKSFNPDFISGCFMLFKTVDFVNLNGFDERYFMYLEDVDICKKIDETNSKKLYYPKEKIIHIADFGSAKNLRLFFFHISSAIKYFNKWGWW